MTKINRKIKQTCHSIMKSKSLRESIRLEVVNSFKLKKRKVNKCIELNVFKQKFNMSKNYKRLLVYSFSKLIIITITIQQSKRYLLIIMKWPTGTIQFEVKCNF